VDEEAISNMVNEELSIDSADAIWKLKEKLRVKNQAMKSQKVSVKQMAQVLMGGKKRMGNNKPKAYTFTNNAGPQFNLLPHAEPMDYFSLFFNDELLNSIVIETNMYARDKTAKLQLSLRSIWNRWSDVSVPETKAPLGIIINMGLIPLHKRLLV
jgi:hypothetical protein